MEEEYTGQKPEAVTASEEMQNMSNENSQKQMSGEGLEAGISETAEDKTGKAQKPLGFGAGLGIGLGIGALAILVIMAIQIFTNAGSLVLSKDSVLNKDATAKINAIQQIIDNYYFDYKDEETDVEAMRNGLFDGLVSSLNDPYSEYYDAADFEELMEETQGIYYGIGAYISISETGYPVISGVMEGTPAEETGLRAEDIIYKVNDQSVYGWKTEDVVAEIKGEAGTQVHLTIYRDGEADYLEFDITRAQVETPSVHHKMLENNIGYIRITQFDAATTDQFASAYQDILSQGAEGLVIDLRSNGGGLLKTALEIGEMLLPEGLIVYTEDKNGNRKEYTSDGKNEIQIPLAVLVNEYAASASEILAGAIKDHEKGILVGTTTFGKGIVQQWHRFSDGTAVKLTEEAYFTPNGNYIQGTGIDPDVEAEFDADKYYDEGIDTQLEKAEEIIREQLGK